MLSASGREGTWRPEVMEPKTRSEVCRREERTSAHAVVTRVAFVMCPSPWGDLTDWVRKMALSRTPLAGRREGSGRMERVESCRREDQ